MNSQTCPALHSYLNCVLYGDCIDLMRKLPDACVDLVVADPPYLVDYRDRTRGGKSAYPNDTHSSWLKPAFAQIYRLLKPNRFCVCFYGWPKAEKFLQAWKGAGFYPVSHLVWIKGYSSRVRFTRYRHENAYLLAKGNPPMPVDPINDVFRWRYAGNDLHPAQKPVTVITPLIQAFSEPGDIVLDPFAGSGTTGEAAITCGRRYVLMEKVWRYCQVARKRLTQDLPHA
jgi:adenine-specific DNA-methyltransferase